MRNDHRFLVLWVLILALGASAKAQYEETQGVEWVQMLGDTALEAKGIILDFPTDVTIDQSGKIYVLQSKSLEVFQPEGKHLKTIPLLRGVGPGEYIEPFSLSISPTSRIYILDRMIGRVSVLSEQGRFLESFQLDFSATRVAFWNPDRLLLLGEQDNRLFHIYDEKGKKIESFGAPFNRPMAFDIVPVGPNEWYVVGNTIYVASPYAYEIRKYENQKLVKTIKGDGIVSPPQVRKTPRGGSSIFFPSGINGITRNEDKLVITLFKMSPELSEYYVEIFDEKTGQSVGRFKRQEYGAVRTVDSFGRVYFLSEGSVMIGKLK